MKMTTKTMRKIVQIYEDLCDGCGLCVPSCAEGAIQIIDGKARLVSEMYCDGLGACLGECPQGAINIEEREAAGFDEEAVKRHLAEEEKAAAPAACGCPSATMATLERSNASAPAEREAGPSALGHWPVQLTLVPPGASFLQGTDLLLAADCVPFAYPGFHQDFLRGHSLLIACPKLDDYQAHLAKLTEIMRLADIKSLTVAYMEVPCCFGIVQMARQAVQASGKDIPVKEVKISIRGEIKEI
jgi:NAD-dependent dihydropyrimidine dehydrogenase PreA subunit